MRRVLTISIVCVWLVMLALLVHRTWPSGTQRPNVEPSRAPSGEEWMGVYHHEQKIGYTHMSFISDEVGGFAFTEESLLRITALDTPQTVRTRLRGTTGADYALRTVEFELSSGVGNLQISGEVQGTALRLTLHAGTEDTEQVIPLAQPVYLPSTLRAFVSARPLRAGQELNALVFDPATLKNDRIHVTVERQEPVPGSADGVQGWRVREEFRGLVTTAWLDVSGNVLREQGPMDLVLVRQTKDAAVKEDWQTDTALDLVASAAVPVTTTIDDARERRSLRLRLSGISLEQIPEDEEQSRVGSVVTITRAPAASLQSYPLPYEGGEHAAELRATPFVQSDHPRIQATAGQVVGSERDALRAAQRINDWVYGYLRKVPTISIPNSLQVLEMGEGDCNEHAVLFAALARAAGIPTRTLAGAVYLNGAFYYHAWCDIWLGRWVSIDPALHQFPADATHIKFVAGDPEDQLAMMEIIGRLGIKVLDDASRAAGDAH